MIIERILNKIESEPWKGDIKKNVRNVFGMTKAWGHNITPSGLGDYFTVRYNNTNPSGF